MAFLDGLRDLKGLAIFSSQEFVGFIVSHDGLGLAVELQGPADPHRHLGKIDPVFLEVLRHPVPGVVPARAALEGRVAAHELRLAHPVGDVGQVAKRGRQVPFLDFGIEQLAVPGSDGVGEVPEVLSSSGEFLEHLALEIERGAAADLFALALRVDAIYEDEELSELLSCDETGNNRHSVVYDEDEAEYMCEFCGLEPFLGRDAMDRAYDRGYDAGLAAAKASATADEGSAQRIIVD